MRKILLYLLDWVLGTFRSRATLQLEIIVLRHHLEVLQRTRPARVRLTRLDRTLWLFLYRLWPRCLDAAVIVKPETVIAWHRKGFRAFWTWKSRPRRRGRPPVPAEIRTLIRRITRENPLWGAPRVHGELLKLGIEISQAAVSKYDPAPEAAIADLEDILSEPCWLCGVCRFLRRTDRCVSALVRVHRPASRAPPHRPFRRNCPPHITVGLATDPRGVSMGDRAAVPHPGSRWVLRRRLPLAASGYGHQRGSHRPQITLAERVRRTGHRNDPA